MKPRHKDSNHLGFFVKGLYGLILILVGVNLILSAQISHLGTKLSELKKQRDHLVLTNQHIQQEITKVSALSDLENQAELLGFSPHENYLTINLAPVYALDPAKVDIPE